MNNRSPAEIFNLPYNFKERAHRSRTRLGFHVYLSWYIPEFRVLPKNAQLELVKGRELRVANLVDLTVNVGPEVIELDDSSFDSTDTPEEQKPIKGFELMRVAGFHWNGLEEYTRIAWKNRAKKLNRRVLPGKFTRVPLNFAAGEMSFEEAALSSMSNEWYSAAVNIQRSLVRRPRAEMSRLQYMIGKERVLLLTQTYRVFQITDLVKFALFGSSRVFKASEKVHETKLVRVVHISSQERILKILSMNTLCGAKIEVDERIHSCAGKVMVQKNTQYAYGYILSETGNTWNVHLTDNTTVLVKRVHLKPDGTGYFYPTGRHNRFVVTQFSPIRLEIKANGTIRYTMNRYAINKATGDIVPQFSA